MKTEKELNSDILEITTKITNKYPELLKDIKEVPVSVMNPDHPEVNATALQEYYNYLESIFEKYDENHI